MQLEGHEVTGTAHVSTRNRVIYSGLRAQSARLLSSCLLCARCCATLFNNLWIRAKVCLLSIFCAGCKLWNFACGKHCSLLSSSAHVDRPFPPFLEPAAVKLLLHHFYAKAIIINRQQCSALLRRIVPFAQPGWTATARAVLQRATVAKVPTTGHLIIRATFTSIKAEMLKNTTCKPETKQRGWKFSRLYCRRPNCVFASLVDSS